MCDELVVASYGEGKEDLRFRRGESGDVEGDAVEVGDDLVDGNWRCPRISVR